MFTVGIDMSKKTFHAAFSDNSVIIYPNVPAGFVRLIEDFASRSYDKTQTIIGVESTGNYHLPLAIYLRDNGWSLKVLNPLVVYRAGMARIRPTKTDKIDAQVIRSMVENDSGRVFNDSNDILTLRALVAERGALVKVRAGLKQRVEAEKYMPGAVIGAYNRVLAQICLEIRQIEKKFTKYESETQALLRTIPGVGLTSAAALVSGVVNIKRFDSARKLTAYLGLDCRVKQSGTSIHGKGYLTKRGNRYLRFVLFNAAAIAKRYIPELQTFYEKKKTEGHHHFSALCATERKLVHLIYAVWTRGTPFERRTSVPDLSTE